MENEIIKERFLGTIFGQAVGDALGLSTEFMSKQEVDRFYHNGTEDYSQNSYYSLLRRAFIHHLIETWLIRQIVNLLVDRLDTCCTQFSLSG